MPSELTNLLPHDRIQLFEREYFMRLATVCVVAFAFLIIACGVLLFPSYLFLSTQISEQNAELTALGSAFQNADQQAADARLSALHANAAYLGTLAHTQSMSTVLRATLAVPHQSVHVNGVTFTGPTADAPAGMTVSGTADSRDALRTYYLALQSAPGVASADLPVSAYAKESDIPFTITLTEVAAPGAQAPKS